MRVAARSAKRRRHGNRACSESRRSRQASSAPHLVDFRLSVLEVSVIETCASSRSHITYID